MKKQEINKKEAKEALEYKAEAIASIGRGVKTRLKDHFKQWNGGLPYKTVISAETYRARRIGMEVGELASELETAGYIKIFNTPSGARYVFSGDCPLTIEEMQNWLQEQEVYKETEREFRKSQRKAL